MPNQSQKQSANTGSNQRLHPSPQDPDIRLILHRLRDLYAQRQHWQSGKALAIYIAPYQSISPGVGLVEHWIGSSEEAEAHLLAAPLNELISYYEQLLWLAKIPLPTL
ncbi:hypothetical protein [Fibrella forsythiae]|uniref:Uncharacterized protein n=1 Tax=Fibrella forsythiae TaxID=2817061 RepID=A0ABS3JSE1_9BACT|nr:hypothetical protein [Fibrella forsythiae]MBO0952926.1 hypothetical protein [Fibrella forsythiae]